MSILNGIRFLDCSIAMAGPFAAQRLGVPARIFVPTVVSPSKLQLIRSCGAEVVVASRRVANSSSSTSSTAGAIRCHSSQDTITPWARR